MTVTMVTLIDTDSVLYTVHTGDPLMGDFGDGREVWRKEVPFGMRERFRPSGPAFVEAAREQEKVAEAYALMPYEPAAEHPFTADVADAQRVKYGEEDIAHCAICGQAEDRPVHRAVRS